jgi:hypothetical protein
MIWIVGTAIAVFILSLIYLVAMLVDWYQRNKMLDQVEKDYNEFFRNHPPSFQEKYPQEEEEG